jgi:hypothetical protein
MAQRRMFSPDIVSSEEFLSMPVSGRELYFQLGMNADDDGFIQPKMIMRVAGATEDDLKILLAKRFLLPFESGVVVIKHWLIHNMIRADRYKPTRFQEEKKLLFIKENKAYTEQKQLGCQSVNQMAPQVRLGKVRLGKVSKEIALSYQEPLKETFNTKKKTFEKLGIPYVPKKKTSAQDLAWQTELLARYIKDRAMELLRIDVYINKKDSGKGWQTLKRSVKEFGLDKCKAHCDKYLISEKCEKFGADVSVMFSEHSMNMPDKKKGGVYKI